MDGDGNLLDIDESAPVPDNELIDIVMKLPCSWAKLAVQRVGGVLDSDLLGQILEACGMEGNKDAVAEKDAPVERSCGDGFTFLEQGNPEASSLREARSETMQGACAAPMHAPVASPGLPACAVEDASRLLVFLLGGAP